MRVDDDEDEPEPAPDDAMEEEREPARSGDNNALSARERDRKRTRTAPEVYRLPSFISGTHSPTAEALLFAFVAAPAALELHARLRGVGHLSLDVISFPTSVLC